MTEIRESVGTFSVVDGRILERKFFTGPVSTAVDNPVRLTIIPRAARVRLWPALDHRRTPGRRDSCLTGGSAL